METTKICCCCKETKDISQFNKNKSKKDGLSTECKSCIKIYKDEYRKNNAEKISISKKKHYEENKEKVLSKCAEWKNSNREYHNKKSREYSQKNRVSILKKNKEYYLKNKEMILKRTLLWFNTEKGKISKRNTHYKRKLAIKNGISTSEIMKHTNSIKNCYWCKCKIDKTIKNGFHIDHYIPLSKGGTHTLENIVISCPSCNILKSNKDPYKFAQEKGRLL